MNGSENSIRVDKGKKYFDSEKLSVEEGEKEENLLFEKNNESSKRD